MKTGILIHVYNLDDPGWQHIAWGEPAEDKLGSLPLLCRMLLTEEPTNSIEQIAIFAGPSQKDGLKEHAYMKQFLLDHLNELSTFPQLRPLLGNDPETLGMLRTRIEGIILGKNLMRTADEIAAAARLFKPPAIEQVIQIACGSHAPRCVKAQVQAREQGLIPYGQPWLVAASDVCFADTSPDDVVIFEKPHLPYDPMIHYQPMAPEVLSRYFALPPEEKHAFLQMAAQFMTDHSGSAETKS